MTAWVTLRQLLDATALQYRASSRELGIILAFVILFPLGFLFFLSVIVQPALRAQVLVGSIMMEMALLNVNVVAQTIGSDKQSKIYDLWVSLPINPAVYVLANSLSVLPYSLLSAAVTLAIGVAFFGIVLSVPLLLLFAALLLIWASTLGVGFLIGVYGSSPRQINTVAQFVGIVMTFFAPIFYPLSALPLVLQYVSYAWPLTWGALLLHALVVADLTGAAWDAIVLAAFTALWAGLVAVGLRWRQV